MEFHILIEHIKGGHGGGKGDHAPMLPGGFPFLQQINCGNGATKGQQNIHVGILGKHIVYRLTHGTQQEYGAIISNGAKLLYAYGEATVPKVTVTLRKSYGGAHIVMSCKQLRGDINYAWPSANIAVMGADGAVGIIYGKEIKAETDPQKQAELIEAKKQEYNDIFCNPYQAAKKGYIEDIIEPRNTRFRVIRALESLNGKRQELPAKKHDNLPV